MALPRQFSNYAGLLSDKIGRRPIIIFGLILFVLGSLVAAVAESAMALVIGQALQGMGAIASTLMALVTDFTSEENRTKPWLLLAVP